MIKEMINKLKKKRMQLKNSVDCFNTDIKLGRSDIEIILVKLGNIYRMKISDYITINEYCERIKLIDTYGIADTINMNDLWNSSEQKVNKGLYYVIKNDDKLYVIRIDNNIIKIDESFKIGDITEERIIELDINDNKYHYFSAKHDKNGSTFYTKYYSNSQYDLGDLLFTSEEAYEEISTIVSNLEDSEEIQNIINTDLIKTHILNDITRKNKQIIK